MKWIKTSERLPYVYKAVMCLCGDNLFLRERAFFIDGKFHFIHWDHIETTDQARMFQPIDTVLEDVIYWMYQEDLPKPEDNEPHCDK